MTHRTVIRLFSSTLIAALILGCGDNIPDVGPSSGLLQVSPLYAGFLPGATQQLTATLNGDPAQVTWETSDANVATVDANGLVTGVGSGTASITAKMASDPTEIRSASITVFNVPALTSGVSKTGVSSGSLARNEGLLYKIVLPTAASALTVTFTGGTGDGDVYVQQGVPPNNPDNFGSENPGCHSWNGGNAESCTVTNPGAGTWYIFVAVWDPYAGATLTATVTP